MRTHEGNELTPAHNWEIVQVNDNNVDDPNDDEYLSVSVAGVRETQWRDCFVWGEFVAPLAKDRLAPSKEASCDCAATTEGKWAGIHHANCAVLRRERGV